MVISCKHMLIQHFVYPLRVNFSLKVGEKVRKLLLLTKILLEDCSVSDCIHHGLICRKCGSLIADVFGIVFLQRSLVCTQGITREQMMYNVVFCSENEISLLL